MTAPTKQQIAETLERIYAEHGHPDDWGVQVIYLNAMKQHGVPALAALFDQPETDDGMANTCTHMSASGVDTAPLGPDKVWRCDHCGMTWKQAQR